MDYSDIVAYLENVASVRMRIHSKHATSRPLSSDYEFIGLIGEYQFMVFSGLTMDISTRPDGDNGCDFRSRVGTIDVKTARKAFNLLRESGKKHSKILVLASYSDSTKRASLLGWEYDEKMLLCPKKDFGYGILNYYKPAKLLRPMHELYAIAGFDNSDVRNKILKLMGGDSER